MSPVVAKTVFVLLAIGWFIIRIPHARRSRRTRVASSRKDWREIALLIVSLGGLGVVPLVYIATGLPQFAEYPFRPYQAWAGVCVAAAALAMFFVSHRALGRNWSISLELREGHALVTEGIYRHIRHPMYAAFWLWTIAQALLLPNWVAGCAGFLGFGTLFLCRIAREEQMMVERFGDEYRAYALHTYRLIPGLY
jgi:protein-S-isoprenylcysteine O-methyltransferase Ste14